MNKKNYPKPLEYQECITLAEWLTLKNVFFIHIANEGKRTKVGGSILKRMGLCAGAPDFLIFDVPDEIVIGRRTFHGVALEMKRIGGRKPNEKQLAFLKRLERRGWCCIVAYGAGDAIDQLKKVGF